MMMLGTVVGMAIVAMAINDMCRCRWHHCVVVVIVAVTVVVVVVHVSSFFMIVAVSRFIMVIAVAEPVDVGISEFRHDLARRRSLCGASTTTWVLVTLCMVVIMPCLIPRFSWITLTTGAMQFVVHDAAVTK